MRCVIGGVKESMQDFSSLVGIRSREHEESEELSSILRTSCSVAGWYRGGTTSSKLSRHGGSGRPGREMGG
jgi:hypothetical protein